MFTNGLYALARVSKEPEIVAYKTQRGEEEKLLKFDVAINQGEGRDVAVGTTIDELDAAASYGREED